MATRGENSEFFARLAHQQGRITDDDLRRLGAAGQTSDSPPGQGGLPRAKGRASGIGPEEAEQRMVIEWAQVTAIGADAVIDVSELDEADRLIGAWLYHTPNGGSRTAAEAGRMKAMGQRPGVPDLTLVLPVAGYPGLYVEMKAPGRRSAVSAEQKRWQRRLRWAGHAVRVADCFDEARAVILAYLRGELTP